MLAPWHCAHHVYESVNDFVAVHFYEISPLNNVLFTLTFYLLSLWYEDERLVHTFHVPLLKADRCMHENLFFYVVSCLPILCPCKHVVAVATVEVNKFHISEEKICLER